MEEYELADWKIKPDTNNDERKSKSISAYYLTKYYHRMKDFTFETYFYDELPEIMPFDKCMIRYENKSPKDSDLWGPVSTKKEAEDMFYTSLRCKTNKGKIYCIRKWVDNIECEFRCFWNEKLVAVSATNDTPPPVEQILQYVAKLSPYIYFYRCVFDICKTTDNKWFFVEYNSWETNSGAHCFNWLDHTSTFYTKSNNVVFKYGNETLSVEFDQISKSIQPVGEIINDMQSLNIEILKPCKPSNWLLTDKFLYVANDIWLQRFDLNFKLINWKRGVFRFCNLELCDNQSIIADKKYNFDLSPTTNKSKIQVNHNIEQYPQPPFKYGFVGKLNSEYVFCRLLHDDVFYLVKY